MATKRHKAGVLNMTAVIEVEIPLLKDLPDEGFTLNIGALTLSLEGRNFILDAFKTNFTNNQDKGTMFQFATECERDMDTFQEGKEWNYQLTEKDLTDKKLKAEFFCSDDDADIEDAFDFENAKIHCVIYIGKKEYKVKATFE